MLRFVTIVRERVNDVNDTRQSAIDTDINTSN